MTAVAPNAFVRWEDFFVGFRQRFDKFRDEVNNRFDQVDQRFDRLENRFDRLELETLRTAARLRNSTLKNPTLLITPVPAYDSFQGIIHPDPKLFPRHAKDFYAMRDPTSAQHRHMLLYLVGFCDIQLDSPENSIDEDDDEDEMQPETVDLETATEMRAVEMLEGILGLDEGNFIKFRARAAELRLRPTPSATKRAQPPAQEQERADEARRPRLDLRPKMSAKDMSFSEDGEENGGLFWKVRTRSTPPSQQVKTPYTAKGKLPDESPIPAPPSRGTGLASTRPFTNPREP
ncbi:hypothetical protein B0J18DRAFT_443033 [Chaetomium sp. MPI-SDFR-AT-0129]|nr:hypothetical protein B0J18DRAFT_443033 [Chaetomium sp. MPI-SDFR-AT-0129]